MAGPLHIAGLLIGKSLERWQMKLVLLMVDMAHVAGLVAAGLHPNPVGIADVVTTTTHKTLRGPRGGLILSQEKYAKQINSAVFPGTQGGPLEHVIAGKAIAFGEDLKPAFTEYSRQIIKNAKAMAEVFESAGTVRVISGGTDNHLMTIDVSQTGLNETSSRATRFNQITTNKEAIPNEKLSHLRLQEYDSGRRPLRREDLMK